MPTHTESKNPLPASGRKVTNLMGHLAYIPTMCHAGTVTGFFYDMTTGQIYVRIKFCPTDCESFEELFPLEGVTL